MLTVTPNDPLVLLVTSDELAEYLQAEITPFFYFALSMATEYFVAQTGIESGTRESIVYGKREPKHYPGLSPVTKHMPEWVEIPIHPVRDVIEVELDGEIVTPEVDLLTRPAQLYVGDAKEVKAKIYAGHSNSEFDARSRMAILMLAGFIVENRGACDLTEAAEKSGAKKLMDQLSIFPVML